MTVRLGRKNLLSSRALIKDEPGSGHEHAIDGLPTQSGFVRMPAPIAEPGSAKGHDT